MLVKLAEGLLVPDVEGLAWGVKNQPGDAVMIDIDPEMTRWRLVTMDDIPEGVRSVVQHIGSVRKSRFHSVRRLLQLLTVPG